MKKQPSPVRIRYTYLPDSGTFVISRAVMAEILRRARDAGREAGLREGRVN